MSSDERITLQTIADTTQFEAMVRELHLRLAATLELPLAIVAPQYLAGYLEPGKDHR
jgi:hypothetical protein